MNPSAAMRSRIRARVCLATLYQRSVAAHLFGHGSSRHPASDLHGDTQWGMNSKALKA